MPTTPLSLKKHANSQSENIRGSASVNELAAAVTKLRNRLTESVTIDYFDSLGRQTAEGLISSLERVVLPAPGERDPEIALGVSRGHMGNAQGDSRRSDGERLADPSLH
jgi:hypothetical protein